MKLTKILPLLPTIALLASCSQPEIKLSDEKDKMVAEGQTAAPTNFVVYPDDRPSIADGQALYKKLNCAQCHGAEGSGGSGPALNDKRMMSTKKPVDMYKFLAYGKAGTPHAGLNKDQTVREIWNLVFYSKALGTPPLTTADMDLIAPVFGSNCAVCHGTKGDGDGPLARNLEPNPANFQTMRRFFDREDDVLYDHIANGIRFEGMPNFLGKEDRKKNFKFDPDNIHKLVAYVRNFQVNSDNYELAANTPASKSPAAAATSPVPGAPAVTPTVGSASAPAVASTPGSSTKPTAAPANTTVTASSPAGGTSPAASTGTSSGTDAKEKGPQAGHDENKGNSDVKSH